MIIIVSLVCIFKVLNLTNNHVPLAVVREGMQCSTIDVHDSVVTDMAQENIRVSSSCENTDKQEAHISLNTVWLLALQKPGLFWTLFGFLHGRSPYSFETRQRCHKQKPRLFEAPR